MLVIVKIKIKIIKKIFFWCNRCKKNQKKSEPHSHIANFKVWE